VQIKLYPESDTRPVGSYEYCQKCSISPNGTLAFTSQQGVGIITTLKFKLTLDEGDDVDYNREHGWYCVTGCPKPKAAAVNKGTCPAGIDQPHVKKKCSKKASIDDHNQPQQKMSFTTGDGVD
jgi:hypothetical protein